VVEFKVRADDSTDKVGGDAAVASVIERVTAGRRGLLSD